MDKILQEAKARLTIVGVDAVTKTVRSGTKKFIMLRDRGTLWKVCDIANYKWSKPMKEDDIYIFLDSFFGDNSPKLHPE